MARYIDKDQWEEEILIPNTSTPILGGQPVWEGDRLVDGFANIPPAILADRTRHLKNKIDNIEANIDADFSSFIRKEDNLSDLEDIQQAKYNLELNLVDNVRDMDKPVSTPQQAAIDLKADKSTSISVGNGLTGGGTLASNRTISLGVPSTITGATTNQATTNSHTHALSIGIPDVSGLTAALDGKEPTLTAGTASQYYRGDKTWQTLNTTAVTEGTNLYFTENRVRSSILTGFAASTNTPISETDNVLTAFNKIQGQINSRLTANQNITISGDATGSGNTSINITLSNTGVTPGTYTKSTIDSKGRVISATNLVASDIPNLDWSKITSGKPTTISGYGITDALQLGTIPGAAPGTASAGTSTTAARSDHVHPIQTTISGNAGSATRLVTARTINGVSFDGTSNITINAVDSTPRIASSEKGAANGVATLDSSGKVSSSQLPSYVDDVLEFASLAAFPTTGESDKIYIAIDTNYIYRWSGSSYIWINASAGSADVAVKLAQARTIAATGDASWSVTFDGSSNASSAITLSNSGVTAGTYNNVATQVRPFTVDAKGRVTGIGAAVTITPAFSNVTGKPTSLSGYGITDATPSSHIGSGGTSHAIASTTVSGFMSAADKSKLDGIASGATSNTGTVTSVGMSVPTGLSVAGSPITGSGVLAISYASGYSIPTNAKQTQWDTAYGWGNHASAGYATTSALTAGLSGKLDVGATAASANQLATARTINGTSFNGTANITTANWGTARTLTVGGTGKSVNGGSNVTWSLAEIGAAAASHNHNAGNITSGTLNDARLPARLGVTAQTITDWNTATSNGWYMSSTAANAPIEAQWFIGNTENHGAGGWCTQTVHAFSSDNSADTKTYRRGQDNGSWGSWYRLRLSEEEQSAIYLNASNLNAGTVPIARMPSLQASKTQVLDGTSNLYVSGSTYQSVISWATGSHSSGTVTLNLDTSLNHDLTVSGNITMASPSNADAGKTGDIVITMTASGTVSWDTNWKFLGSVPDIGASGEVWVISYKVLNSSFIIAAASKVAS